MLTFFIPGSTRNDVMMWRGFPMMLYFAVPFSQARRDIWDGTKVRCCLECPCGQVSEPLDWFNIELDLLTWCLFGLDIHEKSIAYVHPGTSGVFAGIVPRLPLHSSGKAYWDRIEQDGYLIVEIWSENTVDPLLLRQFSGGHEQKKNRKACENLYLSIRRFTEHGPKYLFQNSECYRKKGRLRINDCNVIG